MNIILNNWKVKSCNPWNQSLSQKSWKFVVSVSDSFTHSHSSPQSTLLISKPVSKITKIKLQFAKFIIKSWQTEESTTQRERDAEWACKKLPPTSHACCTYRSQNYFAFNESCRQLVKCRNATQHNVTLNVIAFHVCLVTHINSNRL